MPSMEDGILKGINISHLGKRKIIFSAKQMGIGTRSTLCVFISGGIFRVGEISFFLRWCRARWEKLCVLHRGQHRFAYGLQFAGASHS